MRTSKASVAWDSKASCTAGTCRGLDVLESDSAIWRRTEAQRTFNIATVIASVWKHGPIARPRPERGLNTTTTAALQTRSCPSSTRRSHLP
ncbi:hypothetical protein CBOM_05658 [Ceraceosorus bombacis]|uniref:Uncharacterized protein n=1 Tax=Ceraceosorus bombacis TaxID=401625 RepID=A0A0P1BQ44_9BASI|nr:hypothetical protein CBOM_05658 [Ceraceosorus bombacis]